MSKAVVLCILDGWGHRENGPDNAIVVAKTPHWDTLIAQAPHTLLEASELNVGLPEGQMGNSEVGHMNIGAGRLILQDLPKIDDAVSQHTLKDMPPLKNFIKKLKASQGTCHLLGLLSPGGIHSHERHIIALAIILADQNIPVAFHGFLDGRDTPPQSAKAYLDSFLKATQGHPNIKLATLGGRYFGMDRDKRWDRVQQAYTIMVNAIPRTEDALTYLQQNYQNGVTDEFLPPVALGNYQGMKDGDGILMANFRSDRARQILTALLDPNFQDFERSHPILFAAALGMAEYSETLNPWMDTLFPSNVPQEVLGEVIAKHGLKQLRIAETEKYAHVTFFFNGGREEVFPGEDRILVPSPDVATYDLKPEMSAYELTDCLVDAIESEKYALIVVNYANADMVGHTGNLAAAQRAVEAVDTCLGRIKSAVEKTNACLLITADHGNAEMMFDNILKSPHTAHTLNPVPFVMFQGAQGKLHAGKLSQIAPTILQILNLPIPPMMTETSLLAGRHE
ncbi:MAG: 2,3-bisphosphoglycerate-independent phosphoglycerate mutase [Alphaproteobacteria bacterium]|nr:2,3-bisphosphoglycerate-independent phosphoglycerate mutase [Alphaproteobacteria bacterium]